MKSPVLFSLTFLVVFTSFLHSANALLTHEQKLEANSSFSRADANNNGQITPEELQAELYRFDEDYDIEEIEVLAGPYDRNSSGTLTRSEYYAMWKDFDS